MNTTSRLTIPMDNNFRAKLSQRATDLGFDSSQALLRYVSKAIIDGRQVTFGQEPVDDWGPVPAHVESRWEAELKEHEADKKAGKVRSFTDTKQALDYLHSL